MAEIPTPFAPTPEFPLCVCVPAPPEEICFNFPFGIRICSTRNTILQYQGLGGLLMSGLGNLQPLMAILMPILILISLIKALVDCMFSISDAISQLSPSPLIDCLERLAELFPQLFQMVPPFNYIAFINNVILFLITVLEAFIDAIEDLLRLNINARLDLLPDDPRLRCCLDANFVALFDQLAAGMRMSGPVFLVLAQILSILEVPGLKPYIKPIREAALAMNNITQENINSGLVEDMRALQGHLRKISDILESVGGSRLGQLIQRANNCECDR